MTKFLLLAVLSTALSGQLAYAVENITLDEATALALRANPDIAVVLRGREIESAQVLQAASRPNPTLSGQVEDLRSQNRIATIAISQQLETAGKRDKRMAVADANLAIADAEIGIAQAETSAKAYAVFYQVLAAQQAQTLAQELLQIATQSKETTSKRVLAGKVSPVEETKAKVAEAGLKIDLANANQQLATAKQRLASLWAKGNSQTDYIAVGELEKLSSIPTLSDLMAQLPDSPRLKKASLAIMQKQTLSAIEQSKKTPDVTVSLGARRNEELGGITQAVIGLSIPIPVFDNNQGNLQGARAREFQSIDEKAALQNQLQTELAGAYARRQLQVEAGSMYQQDILQGAQSAYEAARKGFEFGKFSFLEVLDAQRTLFQAKTQFIQTLALARQAEADIQSILGAPYKIESVKKELP
ncbi:TolC family protein [Methylotenera sp.]|uniref:TolC family protein n=1 Tax=Methylotenera sp. TaxID=2051956 RepID=UPI0027303C2C|nr:TolC family protein [Methylotenera sp.]MDP2072367.1 TolC family protein [Methylotenera sp.]MDP3005610.1 TolC family protein [Methylotenera sp.]MDP3817821.1 TolC family protein [Methylotenera sp.]